jgi:hypothetical protein
MQNKKLCLLLLIFLVSTLTGCGARSKFMRTKTEDLAPFADQTISMVADIAGGVEKARTVTLQTLVDWDDPDVKEYVSLREEINGLFRGIVVYSVDIVAIAEANKSGEEKAAALANYLQGIEKPMETQSYVKLRMSQTEIDEILNNIRGQKTLFDGLVAAQPIINEVARFGDEILEQMRLRLLSIDRQVDKAVEERFGYLDALGVALEEKLRLLSEAQGYVLAYKKGDRSAIARLRQMEVIGIKQQIPSGRLTWKQIDEIDQWILSRIVANQKVMKEHDFSFQVYIDTRNELDTVIGNRMARIAAGRLFLFTWARAHQKMAAGKTEPAEWFDISEAPAKLLAAGAKAVF